jgi:DNA processing protein
MPGAPAPPPDARPPADVPERGPPDAALVAAWLTLAACPDARASWWGEPIHDPRERVERLCRAGVPLEPPSARRLERCLAWLEGPGCGLVGWGAPAYPATLAALEDPPAVLFVCGERGLLSATQVAIVGSRRASPAGREHAFRLARDLADAGLVITSGLALGIDAAAHRGALASPSPAATLGVSGCGPERAYPGSHAGLYAEIAARGLLVSEFPPGTPPRPHHFPRRNRLISGLSRAVVVVEAGAPSGSLVTARLALAQGREVLAVPGSVNNPLARGCHALIRDGARLVEDAGHVLEELAGLGLPQRPVRLREPGRGLRDPCSAPGWPASLPPEDARRVLEAMGAEVVDVESVVRRSGLTVSGVSSILAALEMCGLVWAGPAGSYQRRPG